MYISISQENLDLKEHLGLWEHLDLKEHVGLWEHLGLKEHVGLQEHMGLKENLGLQENQVRIHILTYNNIVYCVTYYEHY